MGSGSLDAKRHGIKANVEASRDVFGDRGHPSGTAVPRVTVSVSKTLAPFANNSHSQPFINKCSELIAANGEELRTMVNNGTINPSSRTASATRTRFFKDNHLVARPFGFAGCHQSSKTCPDDDYTHRMSDAGVRGSDQSFGALDEVDHPLVERGRVLDHQSMCGAGDDDQL